MASVQEARAEGSGNIVVQLAGDHSTVNIEGLPHLSLVPLAARTAKAPGGAEIHLLNPYRRAIDLVGRESDLEELWRWPHSERAISVRTIVGRAGAGKTRIAIELMSRLGERKPKEWHAGFLESKEMRRFAGQQNLSQWGWRRPTLLVLDYAATLAQPLREWLRELA